MRKRILLGCLVFILCLCAGCGQKESHTDQESEEETEPVSDAEPEDTTQTEEKEIQNEDTGNITISTSYIPIAHKKDALIVQRSEDIELYGVLDDTGATILEPEYDSLRFVFMNDQDYIAARLGDDFGILKPDGTEYIPLGEYDEIVSAGNIGWLAKKDGKQYLLGTGTERVHQILVKKSGDFYQLYIEDDQELIEGRYADYEAEDSAMFLENIDAQWGLIDYSGNIIIPFGEITQEEFDFYFNGKQMHDIEEFSSKDLFRFYTEDQGMYTVHIFPVDPADA